jgi:hypothetical protein
VHQFTFPRVYMFSTFYINVRKNVDACFRLYGCESWVNKTKRMFTINKGKAVPLHAMEALGGRGGIAPTRS